MLFNIVLTSVLYKANKCTRRVRWRFNRHLGALDYADNKCLLSNDMEQNTTRFNEGVNRVGLNINEKRTKQLRISFQNCKNFYLSN